MNPTLLQQGKKSDGKAADMASMEGARRATGVEAMSGMEKALRPPDPEVSEKKQRRKFTAKYKLNILSSVESCTEPGQIGAILRREGLYSSHLTLWRRQRAEGLLEGLSPKKRGRKKTPKNPLSDKVAKLERENRHLQAKLERASLIIEAQKKISEILGVDQDLGGTDKSK